MQLMQAIIEANHRAVRGDRTAGLRPDEFKESFPLVALTCIDPRLDPILPEVLGVPPDLFVWLRNAGNIITGTMSSTMRSLALASAVKGGREIAVIGHTDCRVRQTSVVQLTENFAKLGVDRSRLPDNLTEFFGLFASERQNVLNATGLVRASPLIGPKIPVHGLLVDVETGALEWLVNGYETLSLAPSPAGLPTPAASPLLESLIAKAATKIGDVEIYNTRIGDFVQKLEPIATPILAAHEEAKKAKEASKSPETERSKRTAVKVLKPWVEAARKVPWEEMAKKARRK